MRRKYKISFNANGGTDVPSAISKYVGDGAVIPNKTPTRNGYSFLGWNKSKTATSAAYKVGDKIGGDIEDDMIVYAVWKKNPEPEKTITISFDANGGTGAPNAISGAISKGVRIPQNIPTRNNYQFLGWSTNKSAVSADSNYARGRIIKPNTNTTLYAVWKINTRRLNFDANGGTLSDTYIEADYNKAINYSNVKPTRDGYSFVGWASEKTIAGYNAIFTDNKSYTSTEDKTLYAIWQKDVKIELIDNVEEDDDTIPESDDGDMGDNVADTTYTDDQTFTVTYIEGISEDIARAQRRGETLTGAAKTYAEKSLREHKTLVVRNLERPKSPSKTFVGWATSADAETPEYTPSSLELIKNSVMLYPVWADDDSELEHFLDSSKDDTCDLNTPEDEDAELACKSKEDAVNPKTLDDVTQFLPIVSASLGAGAILIAIFKKRR